MHTADLTDILWSRKNMSFSNVYLKKNTRSPLKHLQCSALIHISPFVLCEFGKLEELFIYSLFTRTYAGILLVLYFIIHIHYYSYSIQYRIHIHNWIESAAKIPTRHPIKCTHLDFVCLCLTTFLKWNDIGFYICVHFIVIIITIMILMF